MAPLERGKSLLEASALPAAASVPLLRKVAVHHITSPLTYSLVCTACPDLVLWLC